MDASSTMLSSPQVPQPTADIRQNAMRTKRVRDNKHKWELGTRPLPGQKEEFPGRVRPQRLRPRPGHGVSFSSSVSLHVPDEVNTAIKDRHVDYWAQDKGIWLSWVDFLDDDSEVFYSFDAPSGPVRNDRVLGAAIAKAVERFETKETEKLVEEYEFVSHDDPNKEYDGVSSDEDGFEVINPLQH